MTPERLKEIKHMMEEEYARPDSPYSGRFVANASYAIADLLAALEETQHQLHDQDEALIAANGLIEDLQIQLAEAQQTIARQQESMDRASDMMNHRHPAYRLLQDAILPAGEDDQP